MNNSILKKQIGIILFSFLVQFSFAETDVTSSTTEMIDDNFYRVSSDVTIESRIRVDGNVTLYLDEGCTLIAKKGIYLAGGETLTIDGKGTLKSGENADTNEKGSGIGGNWYGTGSGTVIINGGNVYVWGKGYASCIGISGNGANGDEAGPIIINGGHLIAVSSSYAACLGGIDASWAGAYGGASYITITGGIVDLTGNGDYAIGGASNGGYKSIKITGGQVSITGSGIGGANSGDRLIQLGWTDKDDFIKSPSYTYNTLEFLNDFRLDGKVLYQNAVKATASNISGNKIIPWIEHKIQYFNGNNPVDVVFNTGNGQIITREDIALYKGLVRKPADPTKTGYTFEGWYKDRLLTTPWDFENDAVTGDMNLYAKFVPQGIKVFTERYYKYTGQEISVIPVVSTFDNAYFLTEGTDFTYILKNAQGETVQSIVDEGTYTIEVTGIDFYAGKNCSTTFYVEQENTNTDPNNDPNDDPNNNPDPNDDPNNNPDPNDNPDPNPNIVEGALSEQEDGTYYINMNNDGKIVTLDLSDKPKSFSFKVYDDGGKGGSYFGDETGNFTNEANGNLLITVAPEYLIQVSGTVGTKTKYDYLSVYDGDSMQKKALYFKVHGENSLNEYLVNLVPVNTSSNKILLIFKGTSSNCEGLDLTLTIVNKKVLTTKQDLYTSGAYYTSFYTEEENFLADSNTTVFYAVRNSQGKLELCEASNNVILKGNGVILKSNKSNITLYATNDTANYSSILKGTVSDVEDTTALGTIYTLGISAKGGVGFYRYVGSLASGKAYYKESDDE